MMGCLTNLTLPTKSKSKLVFGQLLRPVNVMPETCTRISVFDNYLKDNTVHLEHVKHCFGVDVFCITDPVYCRILEILTKEDLLPEI